jgi:hypothetical protein
VSDPLQTLGQQLVVLLSALWQLVLALGELLADQGPWALLLAWAAWWLWAVNWRRAKAVLAGGAWVAVVLILLIAARVWASVAPGDLTLFGFARVPNFWWQLGAVSLVMGVGLFFGWLQGVLGWTPPEIDLGPPAHESLGHDPHH